MKKFLLAVTLFVATSGLASAQGVPSQVVSVGDGDTIRILINRKKETIRMACIDAPEKKQAPYGASATNRLRQLLPQGKGVQVRSIERDRYGRMVAEVFAGDQSINLQMVKEGQAVVYRRYLNACKDSQVQYLEAEERAKGKRLGFWNQNNPTMPWDYRRNS